MEAGHTAKTTGPAFRIRVVTGKKGTLQRTLTLNLLMNGEPVEATDFFILDDLPFDLIIGFPACKKWGSVLDCTQSTIDLQPGREARRVRLKFEVYRGQHWRAPVLLASQETVILEPGMQKLLEVTHRQENLLGWAQKSGLVTPVRSREAITNRFGVAYAIYPSDR